jgi:hypothetical protein
MLGVRFVKLVRTAHRRDRWPTGLRLARRSLLIAALEGSATPRRLPAPEPSTVLGVQFVTESTVRILVSDLLERRAIRRFARRLFGSY